MSDRTYPRGLAVLVGMAAFVIAMAGLKSVGSIVGPAFLAIVLIITMYPIRVWLAQHRVPAPVASLILLISVYALLVLISLALVISIGRLAALVPTYSDEINGYVRDGAAWLEDQGVRDEQVNAITGAFDVGSLVGAATNVLQGVLGIASDLFFIFTLLLFLAFDAAPTMQILGSLRSKKSDLVAALADFSIGVRQYMAVSAGFGFIVAVLDVAALWLMGIPGAFVWGVLSFVTNFIPNIGFVIGVVPPAIIALLEGGPGTMLAVVVIYTVINFVVQSVIQPRIIGDKVGLSASLTFLSLIFWAALVGPLGALLAVPLSLLLKALLVDADPEARWLLPVISGKPQKTPTKTSA